MTNSLESSRSKRERYVALVDAYRSPQDLTSRLRARFDVALAHLTDEEISQAIQIGEILSKQTTPHSSS